MLRVGVYALFFFVFWPALSYAAYIDLAWDPYQQSPPPLPQAGSIQLQRCLQDPSTQECAPTALLPASKVPVTVSVYRDQEILTPQFGRYIKFTALEELNGGPWASLAELYVFDAGVLIPQSQMRVFSVSSQAVNYEATKAIDENPTTFWHTEYTTWPNIPSPPHTLVLDIGRTALVTEVSGLPRPDHPNGTVARYEVAVSTDAITWDVVVRQGTLLAGFGYCYTALALDGAPSLPSNRACSIARVTPFTATGIIPPPPVDFALTPLGNRKFQLSWSYKSTTSLTGFMVQQCTVSGKNCTMGNMFSSPLSATTFKQEVTLNAGIIRCFRALSINTVGRSEPTPTRCGVVLPAGFTIIQQP